MTVSCRTSLSACDAPIVDEVVVVVPRWMEPMTPEPTSKSEEGREGRCREIPGRPETSVEEAEVGGGLEDSRLVVVVVFEVVEGSG